MYESKDKMVSHPDHYQSETGLEVIDVIEAFTFDLKGIEAVDTGNALKYLCRWKKKNGIQDLEKAKWYLEHLIEHVSKLEEENKPVNDPEPATDVMYEYPVTLPCTNIIAANKCLDRMYEVVECYGLMTVADAMEIVGLMSRHEDCEYGWTNLSGAKIDRHTGEHYDYATISLPKPHPINK